jgi:hypothetical protein
MQAASLSRPQEVTMLTRRLIACTCALALAVPAAAAAVPAQGPLAAYGDPTVAGDTKSDLKVSQSYADRVGSLPPEELAAAYGTTKIDAKRVDTPRAAVVSTDDGTNGWRIAAVAEAGLLAAIGLGTAALVGRARPRRGAAA